MLSKRQRTLTAAEMLELWRLVRHFEPLRSDAAVTRTDGIDLDRLLAEEIDRWYARQFATLPPWQLPQADFAGEVTLMRDPSGAGVVRLPERCHSVVDVWIDGWERPAAVVDCSSPLAHDQSSRYTRGGAVNPVAVVGRAGELRLYTPPASAVAVDRLVCTAWPAKGTYDVTPFMLPEIFED